MDRSTPQAPEPVQQDRNPSRPSRAAVVAVATTVLLATGSSALALSGLPTTPATTGLAYDISGDISGDISDDSSGAAAVPGAAAPQADGDLFLAPGPYGPPEPSVVRALPQAPQPLPSSGVGSASGTVPIASAPSVASPSAGGLGLPALPQLLPAPAPGATGPAPGLALGRDERDAEAEGGPSLGLPPGLLSRPDDDGPSDDEDDERPGRDLLDDEELTDEELFGEQDRPDQSGDRPGPTGPPTDRPERGDDRDPSTEPAAPSAPGGDPATDEQAREQAREQAMAMIRELERRRAAAAQEQRESQEREEQQSRDEEQQRCDLEDPSPDFAAELDERGRITAVRGTGFGESCVDQELQLVLTTESGEVTGTSTISDDRRATFSLSRPVAPEDITGSSLSAS